jgi:hypothetical protein
MAYLHLLDASANVAGKPKGRPWAAVIALKSEKT